MDWIVKRVPNTITCLNLFSGCIACVAAFSGSFGTAAAAIGAAAVFDFLDGLAARLLNARSPMGKELDSLADMVSFGLAPSLILFTFLRSQPGGWPGMLDNDFIPYLAFLIPIFSALRLAKFNIDERQTHAFIGLPTPADAIFWIGYPYLVKSFFPNADILWPSVILILLFSYLMVAEIPMFSLKIRKLGWKSNQMRYLLLASAVVLIAWLGMAGLSVTILLYILLALLKRER